MFEYYSWGKSLYLNIYYAFLPKVDILTQCPEIEVAETSFNKKCSLLFLSLSVSVVNLFLVFRVDNLTREGEMYQNLCFLLNFANCIISLAWSGEERWVRMRSWERPGAGGTGEGRVSQDVSWDNENIFENKKRENKCLSVDGDNSWLCLSNEWPHRWIWIV